MGDSVFGDSEYEHIFTSLVLVATVIGCISSIITIIVIKRMKSTTGHILLLLYITYFQAVYDAFCFTANVDIGYYVTVVTYTFALLTGIASAILSNWMIYIAWYIVV